MRTDAAPPSADPWRRAQIVGRQLAAWSLASVAAGALLLAIASGSIAEPGGSFAEPGGSFAEPGGSFAEPGGSGPAAAATLRALGVQFVVWGAIDGAIAAFGERDRRRRVARGERTDAAASAAFAARLRRLLRINAGLDVVYVAVGVTLLLAWTGPEGLGHGLGVVIQGGFLLAFDAWHGWAAWDGAPSAGDGAA